MIAWFTTKFHLLKVRKEWKKSAHSRHIPVMRRKFKRWAKINPELRSAISVVLGQMDNLAMTTTIFEKNRKSEKNQSAFDLTTNQIRQNFNNIYNLMYLAGADQGKATMKTLSQPTLKKELNSNRIKLEILGGLNAEATYSEVTAPKTS